MPRHTGAENVINRIRHTVVKSHAEYKEVSLCPFQPPGEVHLRQLLGWDVTAFLSSRADLSFVAAVACIGTE